jgi:hypothetical protein
VCPSHTSQPCALSGTISWFIQGDEQDKWEPVEEWQKVALTVLGRHNPSISLEKGGELYKLVSRSSPSREIQSAFLVNLSTGASQYIYMLPWHNGATQNKS